MFASTPKGKMKIGDVAEMSIGVDLAKAGYVDPWEEEFGDLPKNIAAMTTTGERMVLILTHTFGSVFLDEGVWKISGSAQPIEEVHIESAYMLIEQVEKWVALNGVPAQTEEEAPELVASVSELGGEPLYDAEKVAAAYDHAEEKKAFKAMLEKEHAEMMAKMQQYATADVEYFHHLSDKPKHLTEELKGGNQNKKMKMAFNLPGFKGKKK